MSLQEMVLHINYHWKIQNNRHKTECYTDVFFQNDKVTKLCDYFWEEFSQPVKFFFFFPQK